jgi:FixJ family two-component response regulator
MPSSSCTNPTLFVVDDDPRMRESLAALLQALGFECRTFGTAGAFHRFYRPHMPGCLLLDVCLPRQNGVQLYEQLLHEGKTLPAIFLTAYADVSMAVAAMKTGAIGFLEKPCDPDALVRLVRQGLRLDAEERSRDERYAAVAKRIAKLTPTQREMLELIRSGETNKAIAARLAISERAVEMRRATMMRKLQARTAAELVDLAATHRILAELRSSTSGGLTP